MPGACFLNIALGGLINWINAGCQVPIISYFWFMLYKDFYASH